MKTVLFLSSLSSSKLVEVKINQDTGVKTWHDVQFVMS